MLNLRRITLLALTVAGCASSPPPAAPVKPTPVAASNPTTGPAMLFEAKMPADFPDPGPVDQVISKEYPTCRVVLVTKKAGDPDRMFMSLFDHIQSNKIPMTTPVIITWTGGDPPAEASMAFVYGSTKIGKPGPSGAVNVVDLPAITVLSVGVRGAYDADHFQSGMKRLQDYLAAHAGQYAVNGPPRYLAYNSPFVPGFAKFGEVQIPVERP